MNDLGNETLYLSNLNDRVKAEDLKSLLYELCCTYGEVIGVQVVRGKQRKGAEAKPIRGTAFVSYKTPQQAAIAVRNLKSFTFLGKEIQVAFARTRSDDVAKYKGTYKPRYKPQQKRRIGSASVENMQDN